MAEKKTYRVEFVVESRHIYQIDDCYSEEQAIKIAEEYLQSDVLDNRGVIDWDVESCDEEESD